MRHLVQRTRASIRCFVDDNAWVPLAGKAFGITGSLLLLAAIGAGHFDRTFDLGPARAEAAASPLRRPSRAAAAHPKATGPLLSSSAAPSASASTAPSAKAAAAPRLVVLNLATAADLESLPGVGPAKAQGILALREKLGGRFKRFEDLLRVRGIKRRALQKIREHAVLDAPPPDVPDTPPADSQPAPSPSATPLPPGKTDRGPQPAPAAAARSW